MVIRIKKAYKKRIEEMSRLATNYYIDRYDNSGSNNMEVEFEFITTPRKTNQLRRTIFSEFDGSLLYFSVLNVGDLEKMLDLINDSTEGDLFIDKGVNVIKRFKVTFKKGCERSIWDVKLGGFVNDYGELILFIIYQDTLLFSVKLDETLKNRLNREISDIVRLN